MMVLNSMDGLDKFVSTLEHVALTISELSSLGCVHYSDYCALIEALNKDVLTLSSASTQFELVKSLCLLDSATIQTSIDSLNWRNFVNLERCNIRRLFRVVQKRMDKYTEIGQMTDKAKTHTLLLNVASAYTEINKNGSFIVRGDIPRAIYYLAEKAQEHGYSFRDGTFFKALMDGYVNGYKDDAIIYQSEEILKDLLSCLDDNKWYTKNEIKPLKSTFIGKMSENQKQHFKDAIEAKMMEETVNGYKWLYGRNKGNVRLAFFLKQVFNHDGCSETPFKELEALFGVRNLAQTTSQMADAKKYQKWKDAIINILSTKHP